MLPDHSTITIVRSSTQLSTKTSTTVNRNKTMPIDLLLQSLDFSSAQNRDVVVKRLRKMLTGCDVDQITVAGVTALTQSTLDGRLQSVRFLLELGADVNKKDRFGWTALHYAASEGYLNICRFLLERGANARIENSDGEFPVELADDENVASLMLDATINIRKLSTD